MKALVKVMTREDFMAFFRDDEKLNSLTLEDRIEIFSYVLPGSSDITVELLDSLLSDYSVPDILVLKVENAEE